MAKPDSTVQPELEFDIRLPSGMESFTVRFLAGWFHTSAQHWINLVETGVLKAIDLRTPGASKSMIRIPRAELVKFLNAKDAQDALLK
ncbi:MAG: hypothetical protein ACOYM3_34625 [Terrimicrobiaceae bacterium]